MKPFAWMVAGLAAKSFATRANVFAPKGLVGRAEEATALISGWRDLGCYSDDANNLTLGDLTTGSYVLQQGAFVALSTNSPDTCMNYCNARGYSFAGVEAGTNCFCSSRTPDSLLSGQTGCNQACPGPNEAETCGGLNRIQVFTNDVPYPYAQPKTSGLQTDWTYQGCYTTTPESPVLQADSADLSVIGAGGTQCIDYCSGQGYNYAGTGNGYECWCDNDIQGGNTLDPTPNQCVQPCTGNTQEACGSPQRNAVYARERGIMGEVKFKSLVLNASYELGGPVMYVPLPYTDVHAHKEVITASFVHVPEKLCLPGSFFLVDLPLPSATQLSRLYPLRRSPSHHCNHFREQN
ncbi:WSC-domain-containing protein [Karstenula rhodostoma CBS 690.94]|uniref:WSC-domain-containing protein n=1 Tax=Karstenula rhodostoma CBS 690.94 TaxID=1392251 RepID=A0A9P4U8J2_9PLEO|nr:WSC-domain-containing protein [Karstenula rhodostoma CBS 690.94]